jgi:hypothetical protein
MKRFDVSRLVVALSLLVTVWLGASPAHAQPPPLETYQARLSAQDHFNSNGVRLTTVAEIIRQDRANYYVYGKRDAEDQPDEFFSNEANRARLEDMLAQGTISAATTGEILNGTPLIVVKVWQNFVAVDVYK